MAVSINESKLVIPSIPSLFHCSVVKVALLLSKRIDPGTCYMLLKERNRFNLLTLGGDNPEISRAKDQLLLIPPRLRENVLRAIIGLDNAVLRWHSDHSGFWDLRNVEEIFQWKTEGSIDIIKTMQKLLLRKDVSIHVRFGLACNYFLEESIHTLWAEMGESDKDKISETAFTRFWIRRLECRCDIQWINDIPEYLELGEEFPTCAFSAFFPCLQPQERKKFLCSITNTTCNDLILCLYAAIKEEEEKILKIDASKLLLLCMNWPYQNLFLQMVEKMWEHIDFPLFEKILQAMFTYRWKMQDFDYEELCVDFWRISPNHLKEKAKACQYLSKKVRICLESVRARKEFYFKLYSDQ